MMVKRDFSFSFSSLACAFALLAALASAQTFQRLGGCPTLGASLVIDVSLN